MMKNTGMVRTVLCLFNGTEYPMKDVNVIIYCIQNLCLRFKSIEFVVHCKNSFDINTIYLSYKEGRFTYLLYSAIYKSVIVETILDK